MDDISVFDSAGTLLDVNATLLRWLTPSYFLSFIALGMAFWMIRFINAHLFGPLGIRPELKNKALLNMIQGGVLCAALIVPIGQFPGLNPILGIDEGQYVTPAAAFAKRVLADGSDYYTSLFLHRTLNLPFESDEIPPGEDPQVDETADAYFERLVKWIAQFITMDITGIETAQSLAQDAGDQTQGATGNEEGFLGGLQNFTSSTRSAFSSVETLAAVSFALFTSPEALVAYILGLLMVGVIGLWVNLLTYAFPLLYVAIVFLLPISYIFDGMARVVPLIKMMVAFALSKPLAVLFIGLAFSIIDAYLFNLFASSGVDVPGMTSVFDPRFFETLLEYRLNLPYSLPLILGLGSAASIMALLAPLVVFLVLGAEGGTLAGFISSMYMSLATITSRMAGQGAGAALGFVTGGPAGGAIGSAVTP